MYRTFTSFLFPINRSLFTRVPYFTFFFHLLDRTSPSEEGSPLPSFLTPERESCFPIFELFFLLSLEQQSGKESPFRTALAEELIPPPLVRLRAKSTGLWFPLSFRLFNEDGDTTSHFFPTRHGGHRKGPPFSFFFLAWQQGPRCSFPFFPPPPDQGTACCFPFFRRGQVRRRIFSQWEVVLQSFPLLPLFSLGRSYRGALESVPVTADLGSFSFHFNRSRFLLSAPTPRRLKGQGFFFFLYASTKKRAVLCPTLFSPSIPADSRHPCFLLPTGPVKWPCIFLFFCLHVQM